MKPRTSGYGGGTSCKSTWNALRSMDARRMHGGRGISAYPVGKGAPLHAHNCDKHVTLLSGRAEVEIGGTVTTRTR
ncbi:MAG TPA: hypothetical protein VI365_21360 [Trebonia sp.]